KRAQPNAPHASLPTCSVFPQTASMKAQALLPASAFVVAVCLLGVHLGRAQGSDPVAAFRPIVSALPKQGQMGKGKYSSRYDISDIAFDVKKTDSLMTPIVGFIAFTGSGVLSGVGRPPTPVPFSWRYRLEFAWINNRWVFNRLLDGDTGK